MAQQVNLPAGGTGDKRFDPWVGKIPWRKKWQSTPVFLPGKPHGQRSLAGYIVHGVPKSRTQLSADTLCARQRAGCKDSAENETKSLTSWSLCSKVGDRKGANKDIHVVSRMKSNMKKKKLGKEIKQHGCLRRPYKEL